MSPELNTSTDAPSEQPPANMETLMSQLGVAKASTIIVGSAIGVQQGTVTAARQSDTAQG